MAGVEVRCCGAGQKRALSIGAEALARDRELTQITTRIRAVIRLHEREAGRTAAARAGREGVEHRLSERQERAPQGGRQEAIFVDVHEAIRPRRWPERSAAAKETQRSARRTLVTASTRLSGRSRGDVEGVEVLRATDTRNFALQRVDHRSC